MVRADDGSVREARGAGSPASVELCLSGFLTHSRFQHCVADDKIFSGK